VTSLEVELGKKLNVEEVKEKILNHFALIFDAEFVRERIQI
jgi:lipoyl(octanoyl) transferase